MRPVDVLLARLDHVRRLGDGWRADCPAGHRSSGALSIGEAEDGRVLLRCFAGCTAAGVVAAAGLTLADLFPERLSDHGPLARAQRREIARQAGWEAALRVLSRESAIVLLAARAVPEGSLTPEDVARVALAAERIHHARDALA